MGLQTFCQRWVLLLLLLFFSSFSSSSSCSSSCCEQLTGFRNTYGVFVIGGLHGLPIWLYVNAMLPSLWLMLFFCLIADVLPPLVLSSLFYVLAAGWATSFAISSWFIATHIGRMLDEDIAKK